MDRLKFVFLFSAFAPTLSGVSSIIVMLLGYHSWPAILGASLIGLPPAWLVSRFLSRNINRNDIREKLISDFARENDSSDD